MHPLIHLSIINVNIFNNLTSLCLLQNEFVVCKIVINIVQSPFIEMIMVKTLNYQMWISDGHVTFTTYSLFYTLS